MSTPAPALDVKSNDELRHLNKQGKSGSNASSSADDSLSTDFVPEAPRTLSPSEQFASIFLQIQKNREWLNGYSKKLEHLKSGGWPTRALEMEHKAYEANQRGLLKKAFDIWMSSKFPQWTALGQKLYTEISHDQTASELLIKTANMLAMHYLTLARKLANVSFQQEPHHEVALKKHLINAIYFAEDALKQIKQRIATVNPLDLEENIWITSNCYALLANQKIKDEDRQLMQRVLGVEDEIPKITEQLKEEVLIKQRVVVRLGEVISAQKAKFSAFANKYPLPTLTTAGLHSVWDFSALEKQADLTEYAKKIADRHPKTGETVLHILAQRAMTARDRAIIQKLVTIESQLIREGILTTKSALAMTDNAGQYASDVAIDTKVLDFLGSHPIEGELPNYQYWYEPTAGWGIISLKRTYAIDNLRIALQLVNGLIAAPVPNSNLTLGFHKTPVVVRTSGLEYDYHPSDAPKGDSCLEKILISDRITNDQAALTFTVAPKHRANPDVTAAIMESFAKLGLTSYGHNDTAWALLVSTIRSQDVAALSALLKIPRYTEMLNNVDAQGISPLSCALEYANLNQEIGSKLVRAGADPTKILTSPLGKTTNAFKLAVYNGYDKVVNEMIIQIIMKKSWSLETLKEQLGQALFRAVFTGHVPLVEVLLKHNANPNMTLDNKTLCAAFTHYIEAEDPGFDKELLGDTPYLWAIGLLSGDGYTQPYSFAKMVEVFSKHPKTDKDRVTVSRMNHCLLQSNTGIQRGDNPLMVAVHACSYSNNRMYHLKILHLLSSGANPYVVAFNGKTAYQIAGELQLNDLARLFDDFKANGPKVISNNIAIEQSASRIEAYLGKLLQKDKEFSTQSTAKRGLEAFGLTGKQYLVPDHFKTLPKFEKTDFYKFMNAVEKNTRLFESSAVLSEYNEILIGILGATDVRGIAKTVLSTFATFTQLNGWDHVLKYINDPEAYLTKMTRRGKLMNTEAVTRGGGHFEVVHAWDATGTTLVYDVDGKNFVEELQDNPYIKEALFLLSYLVNLAHLNPDPHITLDEQALCVLLLMTEKYRTKKEKELDLSFATRSGVWMKAAEVSVTNLLKRHAQRFAAFRDLQRRGVAWPHSALARRDIESAGFTFRPMMVKRDRCVCDTCGVEVSGWKRWNNAWGFHNYAKHTPDFKERAIKFGGMVFEDTPSTAAAAALAPAQGPTAPMLDSKQNAEADAIASSAVAGSAIAQDIPAPPTPASKKIGKRVEAQLIAAQNGVAMQLAKASAAPTTEKEALDSLLFMGQVLKQAEAFLSPSSFIPASVREKVKRV